jgi:hypothetical protein
MLASHMHLGRLTSDFLSVATPALQAATGFAAMMRAPSQWRAGWGQVYAAEERQARFKAMTVKFLCPDGKVRSFLLDTGASASLLPMRLFRKVCRLCNLLPSRHRLRAANGMNMGSQGSAVLELRLPDGSIEDEPVASHTFEVMRDGAIPASLQILGVDFWDRLQPEIKWGARTVECTGRDGSRFSLAFEIGGDQGRVPDCCSLSEAGDVVESFKLYASEDLHLRQREQRLTQLLLPPDCGVMTEGRHVSIHSNIGEMLWSGAQVAVSEDGSHISYLVQNSEGESP